ncbi:MAG TPA: DUF3305 domain-containing protein [Gammaproteobacteria bacterium]|nr:DUF3305 domain-containing protein [Gammaproteobacteria bacterium]
MRMQPLVSIPVAAVLARKEISRSGWKLVNWEGVAVLVGERFAAGSTRGQLLHEGDGAAQYLWDGLRLELYRDAAETYWFNLTASRPALFIICSEDGSNELTPVTVTADHAESTSAVEADCKVFAVPIPPEILGRMEEFVMSHFKPAPPRKRRRQDWSGEGQQ